MEKNKKSLNKQSGFSAMELWVAIAIIVVLSFIIFSFLKSAKDKSSDTTIKSALNQALTQADIFYSTGNTYAGLCNASSNTLVPKGINDIVYSASKASGYAIPITVNGSGDSLVRCNATALGWAAEAPLRNGAGYYCVDYTKKGIITSISIGNTYAFCR